MALKYTITMLKCIRKSLPRRPRLDDHTFLKLQSLSILKAFRGKGKLHQSQKVRNIPVRVTAGSTSYRAVSCSTKVDNNNKHRIKSINQDNLISLLKTTDSTLLKCGLMNCRSVKNKSSYISDLILENGFDCVALTETWLSAKEDENRTTLSSLVPQGHNILHVPRPTRGGGVGFIFRENFKAKLDTSSNYSSFECQTVLMDASSFTFRFIIIYRIPPSSKNKIQKSKFIEELGDLLEATATLSGKLVLLGDFNVHLDSSSNAETTQLTNLLNAFGLVQHVKNSTHIDGHTLDLVVSRESDDIVQSCDVGAFASDHNTIHISLRAGQVHPPMKRTSFRKIKSISSHDFSEDIQSSTLTRPLPSNVDDAVRLYNNVLQELLDKHAPLKTQTIAQRPQQPWMNEDIREAKKERRRWEKLWRKTRLTVHRQAYKEHCDEVKSLVKRAKADYFTQVIEDCQNDQGKLFKIVDKLLGRERVCALPEYSVSALLAERFNDFFVTKISTIRTELISRENNVQELKCPPIESLLKPSESKLLTFRPTNAAEITKIIKNSSKASCSQDPIPTSLIHEVLPTLAPVMADIVNTSLSSGKFPTLLKSAVVCPLLKKIGLDKDVFKNYRPVSNLPFLAKTIEKVIAARLVEHMTANDLMDPMQSAYRKGRSTETALLRIQNDILCALDKGKGVCLVLLDLSAAFDTVDHTILLSFLEDFIGLDGSALAIFKSYLEGRTQCVSIDGVLSEVNELLYGVPQGSVLGPIAFCIYTIPIGSILNYYNISYHIYADDTQLYCTFDAECADEVVSSLQNCLADIRSWMIKNKLKINDDKTEFLVITSRYSKLSKDIQIKIGQSNILPSASCKSLGVLFDDRMTMDAQVANICRAALFHIRNISAIRDLLPSSAVTQLVHSLVSSRMDYCNSLLYSIPDYRVNQIQRVQNVAARVVSRSSKYEHITPILKDLHWLPVNKRIVFKILLLTYKCVNGLAPSYLSDLVTVCKKDRVLRSNSKFLLSVPATRLKSYGDRSFSYAAASEWNKLPINLRLSPSLQVFKAKLKTYLFQ